MYTKIGIAGAVLLGVGVWLTTGVLEPPKEAASAAVLFGGFFAFLYGEGSR